MVDNSVVSKVPPRVGNEEEETIIGRGAGVRTLRNGTEEPCVCLLGNVRDRQTGIEGDEKIRSRKG